MKMTFKVGDRVNVSRGGTVYVVTSIGPGTHCKIREEGTAPNGKPYAEQIFDTSLLDFEDPQKNMHVAAIKRQRRDFARSARVED